jgi:hypothetical protein
MLKKFVSKRIFIESFSKRNIVYLPYRNGYELGSVMSNEEFEIYKTNEEIKSKKRELDNLFIRTKNKLNDLKKNTSETNEKLIQKYKDFLTDIENKLQEQDMEFLTNESLELDLIIKKNKVIYSAPINKELSKVYINKKNYFETNVKSLYINKESISNEDEIKNFIDNNNNQYINGSMILNSLSKFQNNNEFFGSILVKCEIKTDRERKMNPFFDLNSINHLWKKMYNKKCDLNDMETTVNIVTSYDIGGSLFGIIHLIGSSEEKTKKDETKITVPDDEFHDNISKLTETINQKNVDKFVLNEDLTTFLQNHNLYVELEIFSSGVLTTIKNDNLSKAIASIGFL